MILAVTGLNHNTAPVDIREKFDFTEPQLREALDRLKKVNGVNEALILSTCNRVEIVTDLESKNSINNVIDFLADFHQVERDNLTPYLYFYYDSEATRHIFRVSSALDSMIVGETQILGQVKSAFHLARESRSARRFLCKVYDKAFTTAKRVRTETGIGNRAVSVGYASVELAKKIFSGLEKHSVMIVGAGEMSETVAENLLSSGVAKVYFVNRTLSKAEELAEKFNGEAAPYDKLEQILIKANIVITSTAAPDYIFEKEQITRLMKERRNRHLFMIDIAVPRDIDPKIHDVDNVFLYDIDDLKDIVEENLKWRKKEAAKGELIVEEEVNTFCSYVKTLEINPVIKELREKLEKIRKGELERSRKYLGRLEEKDMEAIDKMTQSIINRILHEPVLELKEAARKGRAYETLETVRDLFKLTRSDKNED